MVSALRDVVPAVGHHDARHSCDRLELVAHGGKDLGQFGGFVACPRITPTGANHAVALLDPPDKIRKTIMRATTDSSPAVAMDTAGPGVLNLIAIYQAFANETDDEVKARFHGMRYGDLKKQVADMVIAHLEPFQQRREIASEPGYLDRVLAAGAERVSPLANQTVRLVKERMGLYT